MKPTLSETILQITAMLILAAGVAATGVMIYQAFTATDIEGYRQEVSLAYIGLSLIPALSGLFLWALANVILEISDRSK
mgnify:FL=1|jgi:conjugal transfer/entry exclusion protein